MGREIRRVPANWEHPKNDKGYIPLFNGFSKRWADWKEGQVQWDAGMRTDFRGGWQPRRRAELSMSYIEWDGKKPIAEEYMPEWLEEQRTHLMMYETCTEGTPISPAFETPEELARWLADNGASAFGDQTATYEKWLDCCRQGSVPSAVLSSSGLESGVRAFSREKKEEK